MQPVGDDPKTETRATEGQGESKEEEGEEAKVQEEGDDDEYETEEEEEDTDEVLFRKRVTLNYMVDKKPKVGLSSCSEQIYIPLAICKTSRVNSKRKLSSCKTFREQVQKVFCPQKAASSYFSVPTNRQFSFPDGWYGRDASCC